MYKGMGAPLATVALFNAVLFSSRGQMEVLLKHSDGKYLSWLIANEKDQEQMFNVLCNVNVQVLGCSAWHLNLFTCVLLDAGVYVMVHLSVNQPCYASHSLLTASRQPIVHNAVLGA